MRTRHLYFFGALIFVSFFSQGCSSKQQLDSNEESTPAPKTVFVEPLQVNEHHRQMLNQLNSDNVLSLVNTEMGVAINLTQGEHQRLDHTYSIGFKASVDGEVVRFDAEMRRERDPKGRVAFVGQDDAYLMILLHFADSLKAADVPVGDMAMRNDDLDSLSFFDVKLVKRGTNDTTHFAFWGNMYTDHRLHGHWELVEIIGYDDMNPDGYENNAPNIIFHLDQMTVKGFAGCNKFSGTFRQFGKVIDVSTLAMTKMYCEGRPDVLPLLGKSTGYRIEGDRLIFEFPKGDEVVFEKRS